MLARSLSLEEFGLLNVGIALAGLTLMATTLGLTDLGTRDVAVEPDDSHRIAAQVLGGRLLALGFAAALGLPLLLLLAPASLSLALVMTLALALSGDWLLRATRRTAALGRATALGGVVVLGGSLAVVSSWPTLAVALVVFAAGEAVTSVMTWRASPLRRAPRPLLDGLRGVVRRSWPLGLSALVAYSAYANLDTILLSVMASAEEAGLYSAPYRLYLTVNVLGTFAGYALLPVLARALASGSADDARALLVRPIRPLLAYGLLCLGGAELLAAPLLRLAFGSEFGEMRAVLIVLMIAVPWYSVAFPAGYGLVAAERGRAFLAGAAVAGSVNLTLNLVLIPLAGADGAAAATAVGVASGAVVWLAAQRLIRPLLGLLLALVVCSGGAIVAAAAEDGALVMGAATVLASCALGASALRAAPEGRR